MSVRALRIGAVLLPAALVLHELAYLLAGGGLIGAHHYLQVLVPVAAAGAASMTFASLLIPALGEPGGESQPFTPFALAGALLGVFVVQELAEATLLGGGAAGLAASLSVAWLAPPLALLLGALAGALIVALDRAGRLLAQAPTRPPSQPRVAPLQLAPVGPSLRPLACRGLSFGFARRPPPRIA
jgi:hypothetical protein